jgi:4-carboxymuconolactone decarboxylase
MSRIPYPTEAEMTDHQRRRAQELTAARGGPVSGPGAFWLRNPFISECAEPMRQHMERKTSLPLALSELTILVAARHWSATYAWCRHEPQAIGAGIDAAAIAALRDGQTPDFREAKATLTYRVARILLASGGLDAQTYQQAVDLFGLQTAIELVSMVGYGSLVSLSNTTFEPDPPGGAPDYLPLGPAPKPPTGWAGYAPRLEVAPGDSPLNLIGSAAAAWRRCPEIARCAAGYDETLRSRLTMPSKSRALVVMLVVRHWRAAQLWSDLRPWAVANGLDERSICDIENPNWTLALNPDEILIHDFAFEMLNAGRAGDAVFAAARKRLGLTILTEIPALVGFMTMVALTANVFASSRVGRA